MRLIIYILTIIFFSINTVHSQQYIAIYKLTYSYDDELKNINQDSLEKKLFTSFLNSAISFEVVVKTINTNSNIIEVRNNSKAGIEINQPVASKPPYLNNGIWLSGNTNRVADLEVEDFPVKESITAVIHNFICNTALKHKENQHRKIWFSKDLPQAINPGINCPSIPFGIVKYVDFSEGVIYELIAIQQEKKNN